MNDSTTKMRARTTQDALLLFRNDDEASNEWKTKTSIQKLSTIKELFLALAEVCASSLSFSKMFHSQLSAKWNAVPCHRCMHACCFLSHQGNSCQMYRTCFEFLLFSPNVSLFCRYSFASSSKMEKNPFNGRSVCFFVVLMLLLLLYLWQNACLLFLSATAKIELGKMVLWNITKAWKVFIDKRARMPLILFYLSIYLSNRNHHTHRPIGGYVLSPLSVLGSIAPCLFDSYNAHHSNLFFSHFSAHIYALIFMHTSRM